MEYAYHTTVTKWFKCLPNFDFNLSYVTLDLNKF